MTGDGTWLERCIAVDPGKLTGMCVMQRYKGPTTHTVSILRSAELGPDECIPTFREWYREFWQPANVYDNSMGPRMRVVMESFKITPRTAEKGQDVSWALRTQGAVEQACRDLDYPVEAIQFFSPDKKKAFPNPRLKKLGLWHVGGKGHALDSIRHGTLYLSQTGLVPEVS